MKKFCSLVLCFFTFVCLSAQTNLTGFVKDALSNKPIEFAIIGIYDAETNKLITGTSTDISGQFEIQVKHPNFYIEASFLGFKTQKRVNFSSSDPRALKPIEFFLEPDIQSIDEVEIRAEKSQTEFKLDKRVFNVGKDLSSTGASALEVLNNVPSVDVNIEGQVSLRGSAGVQILINGKPSVLADDGNALGSITADMIEKVEVITNPSAKYEAEGTSGIINIVLKKEQRKGINGSLSINVGIPQQYSIGLSVNQRTNRFNFFGQGGVGYRTLPRQTKNININKKLNRTVNSESVQYRNEFFTNLTLGSDYYFSKNSVLTLSGNVAYELENQPSETNYRIEASNPTSLTQYQRTEETTAKNPKWQYELKYKKDFKNHKKHDLNVSFQSNFFGKRQQSEFLNKAISNNFSDERQTTQTAFKEAKHTFNIDYAIPVIQSLFVETGLQYVIQNVANDFAVHDVIDDQHIPNVGLTNIFLYQQNVLGAYSTFAFEQAKWGVKGGLRMEHTDLETQLVNTKEMNNQNYSKWFPSLHASYKLTKHFSIQAGYSKRIYRPRLWDLNPFFNIRDNYNIWQGNPKLSPEFTNSYELNTILLLTKASINASVYYRSTTDLIERVSILRDNVRYMMPLNIGVSNITGFELNTKYDIAKWLTASLDANYDVANRSGSFLEEPFKFTANRWTTKGRLKFNLPANIKLDITGNYNAPTKTVQGIRKALYGCDLGVQKKIGQGKSIISLSVRDLFASRKRQLIVDNETIYLKGSMFRGRYFTLSYSYGFGKGEAMQYSGGKRY